MKLNAPFAIFFFSLSVAAPAAGLQPPVAPTRPHSFDFHGHKIDDPYHWLKDKKNPEVIQYIQSENAYREGLTSHLKPFEDKLYREMLSHIKQTDLSVPVRDNGFWYYSRTEEGKQYPIFCRKKGSLTSAEEILLDVNKLAEGKKFLSVRPIGASDDGNLYAYLTDVTGFREYYLSVKDLKTGKLLEDKFVKVSDVEWVADNKTLFYVTEDAAKRPHKLFRHALGEPKGKDKLLYEEKDELYRLSVSRTHDKKYLVHTSVSSTTSEQSFLDGRTPDGEFKVIAPRKEGVEYSVDHRDGLFHIRTNRDGAVNFKWMSCPVADTSHSAWKEFETYRPGVFLEGILLFKDFAVVAEREAGVPQLRVYNFRSKESYRISFPEKSYAVNLGANPEFDTLDIHFDYTSLVTPRSVFEFNLATRERKLLKATEVPGGFDAKNYVSERIEATAPDGLKVPISLVYRKGLVKDGKAPIFLYSYGSYGFSTDPFFDPTRLVLLDRGVVFALAHIRGGSDMGRQWYLDGKLMHKKNTFTDFIACADELVRDKYGARDRLAIEGRSAGGLLIGATLNLRPDLCKVAHLGVPFVDLVNTMLDESLPLTVQEFLEWGNPKQNDAGRYMLQYSPYDNLARTAYPSILVTTSLNDSQVLYHEPTKYVARLRTLKTDKNPLILKCNMDAGHGGASGRYEALREKAYELAFILNELGIKD
ncbi:MAG TPA: S9 family peptidase [Planctomycetaceae bacterium]|nr:S9 family peptidase [Planctomycetaceae bacterium]